MTTKLMMAFLVGFIVSSVVGAFLVPFLRKIKAGQMIKEIGPSWHMSKSGTPTMGGLMFIAGVTAACLTAGWSALAKGEYGHILCLLLALVFGAIGFLDDYEKLRHKQNLGLTAGKKFLLQLAASVVFILLMRSLGYISTELYIPFVNTTVSIPEPVYFILAAFIIVGTVNSVNLTDGVDGLATGTTIPVMLFFVVVTFCWGDSYTPMGVFASGLAGGLLGFLIYNFNPAKVFMGDTGSLFLGGAVAALAFAYDMPLILITLGIVYIIETLSDIIQVGYFKLSGGKRVFKMAPFHHHLEMGGWTGHKWTEKQLFCLFGGTSAVFAVISFLGVMHRFTF
ncbi:MAG: phospho-N-acetylmuramoyl-pentapeptide-transferase [Oscillospiraceae bacterium]|nr:phospho-N-acetylmuramoyl-pentapeptide-transferase [Oscillospiraceae bacterium]MDD6501917.1 phospho-N-acetylmuramoyl-pentapeptide-transferase [Oscillospiraceae bacterium]MDY4105534.1 phospho-N-acetylmuramoyl-pentapeptide-transferase [Oscillospiraceae bacterium]